MIVKCVESDVARMDIPLKLKEELKPWLGSDSRLPLTTGDFYTVYGLVLRVGLPWYFLADDDYIALQYPLAYCSVFFEEADKRVSSCWNIGLSRKTNQGEPIITFKEWEEDPLFFERLVDGGSHQVAIFKRYKDFMDLEMPSPLVKKVALALAGC